jgi:glycosyltransferase involved in cell wall biosynthesis
VISLLRDPAQRNAIGAAAYRFVCEQYDWSAIMPRMLKVYEELGVA